MSPPYEDRNVINVAAMTAWRKQKGLNTLNQPTTRDSYVLIQKRHYHKYHIFLFLHKYARRRILHLHYRRLLFSDGLVNRLRSMRGIYQRKIA